MNVIEAYAANREEQIESKYGRGERAHDLAAIRADGDALWDSMSAAARKDAAAAYFAMIDRRWRNNAGQPR